MDLGEGTGRQRPLWSSRTVILARLYAFGCYVNRATYDSEVVRLLLV